MALIDKLAEFASPASVSLNWTLRLDMHFLGGRRHVLSSEVADIGMPIFIRLGGRV
jgi:hypothetical protein